MQPLHKSRRRPPRGWMLAAGALISATQAVLAGPPLITDDPETLPKGRFELNTAYTLNLSDRSAASGGRAWEQEAPIFDLNYGLLEGVQLKFEVPFAVSDPADGSDARAGIGDLSLGVKLRLVGEADAPLSVSIYPAVGLPLGSSSRGLGAGRPSLTLPVQIGRHFLDDRLFLYADFGYQDRLGSGESDQWFAGLAAEYLVSDGVVLCGELRHEFGVRELPEDSLFNVGFKWTLTESAAVIGSAGRSFDPRPDAGSALLVYFGIQWSF